MSSDLAAAYLRWAFLRAALARGWWLVTALYLVVDARLSASQLVLVGVFQGATVIVAEVPAGVLADAVSRRLAVVLSHVVRGAGMVMTGFVTDFRLLVVAQCLWGLGWALSSGADVAWITDELDDPDRIDGVLVAEARRELAGTVAGVAVAGAVAWATHREAVIVGAGIAMMAMGAMVARWPETGFVPVLTGRRRARPAVILRQGAALARADRVIVLVLVATALVNGGAEGFGRLRERRLVLLGLPEAIDPIAWFTALALAGALAGALTLRTVEAHIHGAGVAIRTYVAAAGAGVVGVVVFAHAPSTPWAAAGALVVTGIAFPITRVASTVLVNRRTASGVRATVHSMLSQAENAGELVFGLALAAVAGATTGTVALLGSALLVAAAGVTVSRASRRSGRRGGGRRPG
ncbi:MAG TPA: MFS transporter [Iamia sp.]|nr:MFS transporter [Iamia sp.]